jgi:PEP-CTERM motif
MFGIAKPSALLLAVAALLAPSVATAASVVYTTLSAFQTAHPTQSVIEDFESFAPKDAFFPSISTPAVTVNAIAGGAGNVGVSSPGYTNYDPSGVPTPSSIVTANGDEAFEFVLAAPSFAIGMDLYLNDFGPATLSYYNGSTLLGSVNFAATPGNKADNWVFSGFWNDVAPVTRFTWISTLGGQLNTGVDTLRTTGAVPEPATWAMMIGGFGAIGGAMRYRRRKASVSFG